MNRRLFISQAVAGMALYVLPFSLSGSPTKPCIDEFAESVQNTDKLARTIQSGLIGALEQLAIIHVYNPKTTTPSALVALVQQDFALATQLTGLLLPTASQALFTDSPSAPFGSYSTSFTVNNTAVTWQGLAYIGDQTPDPTGTLRLFGNAGVLQMITSETSYQIFNLSGKQLS